MKYLQAVGWLKFLLALGELLTRTENGNCGSINKYSCSVIYKLHVFIGLVPEGNWPFSAPPWRSCSRRSSLRKSGRGSASRSTSSSCRRRRTAPGKKHRISVFWLFQMSGKIWIHGSTPTGCMYLLSGWSQNQKSEAVWMFELDSENW